MEMSHRGVEGESLLRPDQRSATVMPHNSTRPFGWESSEPEKAPFIRNEPVKLTPAWEGSNLPNDTLNLKGVGMELAPPKDKWNLIYLTLMLHGFGTLTAWNMFITEQGYFLDYKLKDVPQYRNTFVVYSALAAQIPNFLFSWVNVFFKLGGSLTTRIVWSLSMEVLIFVVTVSLAMIDSSQWPEAFYWITMISVFLLNTFNAIFQNSVYGVAARLPPKYTGAVVLGSNICGTLVSLLSWLMSVVTTSSRTAAIYYFITGIFVLLLCFDTYFALPLNRYYRYHDTLRQRTLRVNPALAATHGGPAHQARPPFLTLFRQSFVQLYNVFMVFFITLAVFPAVHSEVKSFSGLFGGQFTRFTCFLTFNLTAVIGNITASSVQIPRPRWLVVFTTLRLAFIPLFLLCNYQPKDVVRTLPVLIDSDYAYWAIAALMGWSSGHGSSLGMMYVSGTVAPEHAATVGMMGAATLVTGIISGIAFSGLAPSIVSLPFWSSL